MERTLKATITVVPFDEGQGPNARRGLNLQPFIRNMGRWRSSIFPLATSSLAPELPLAHDPTLGGGSSGLIPASGQTSKLYIMSCVHRNWESEILLQDPVDHITTDRAFFAFLKIQVPRRRNRIMSILSCRRISEIHFVKVSPKQRKC